MNRLLGVAALSACFAAAPLSAQSMIGTTPGTPTTAGQMVDVSGYAQTFVPTGTYMTDITFWFFGGTRGSTLANNLYTTFFINQGLSTVPLGPSLYTQFLDPTNQGAMTINLDYLSLAAGSQYTFGFWTLSCGSGPCGGTVPNTPITGVNTVPSVLLTTVDAYAGGQAYTGRGAALPGDIRFKANFTNAVPVPEPATWLLILSGLLGLAMLRRRNDSAA